jgi:hypothetical protein
MLDVGQEVWAKLSSTTFFKGRFQIKEETSMATKKKATKKAAKKKKK